MADTKAMYLDLLKKSLLHSLWTDQDKVLVDEGMQFPPDPYADSMLGLKRMDNIQFCIENVLRDNIQGDLLEAGVWRGGACVFMRALLKANDIMDRKVWVCDSFEGLPPPNEKEYPKDKNDINWQFSFLRVPLDVVAETFHKYDMLDDQVMFLKGWFKDSLPTAPIEKLAVLRCDGDMYESTWSTLSNLYPKLSKGGYTIIDDYVFNSVRAAVDDYRSRNFIWDEVIKIDHHGAFWRKS